MAVTIVLGVIAILVLIAGLAPTNFFVVKPTEKGGILRFGKLVRKINPGWHLIWLFEWTLVDDVRERQGKIPLTRMAVVGRGKNYLFDIDAQILYEVDDPVELWLGFQGDVHAALVTLTEGALTTALMQMEANPFDDDKAKQEMIDRSKIWLITAASRWGLKITDYLIQRISPPQAMLEAAEIQIRAKAEAEATAVTSAAETLAYRQQKDIEGDDWFKKEVLQTWQDGMSHGAFQTVALGGNDPTANLVMKLLNEKKEQS